MKFKKHKILFVSFDMSIGGIQKSLLELLNNLDMNKYDIDLLLYSQKGELLKDLNKSINIQLIDKNVIKPCFSKYSIVGDVFFLFHNIQLLRNYILTIIKSKNKKSKYFREKYWELSKNKIKEFEIEYDIVINYAGGIDLLNEYTIDKIKAKKKICWIHGDYNAFGKHTVHEKEYYLKFDKLVFVSKIAKNIMVNSLDLDVNKTLVIENLLNFSRIEELSSQPVSYEQNCITLVSVSRLVKGKGLELGLKAFNILIKNGIIAKWIIIGNGYEYKNLKKTIKKFRLENFVYLLGELTNPYPYIKKCDIFFHCSRNEGKSIAIEEALFFKKPILVTKYPTVYDQVISDNNGLIVDRNVDSIYQGLMKLVVNHKYREKLTLNIYNENKDTIKKFEQMILD